jgi:phosphatidylglycerophosphate synthase
MTTSTPAAEPSPAADGLRQPKACPTGCQNVLTSAAMFRLPNILTIFRIVLVPVFAVAFVLPGDTARLVAFGVFCIAGLSDALDGFAARKLNAGSDFGRMLDPIADKILVGVALMMLVAEGNVHQFNLDQGLLGIKGLLKLVPALIILSREILVSGLREFLAGADVSVPVTFFAKIKTTIQMVAIGAMILGPMADRVVPGVVWIAYVTLWVAAALTVATGYVYLRAGLAHTRRETHA